jgi:glycosyltransferase involved in cell wall biosynthesis
MADHLQVQPVVHVTTEFEVTEVQALGVKLPEVYCAPNGVQWPINDSPVSGGPFADLPRPYALFLSRISWKKGLDRLINAWAMAPDMHLVVAGND